MKIKALTILFLILISLIPAYYTNQYLQQLIAPRRSFGRLMSYMLLMLAFVFVYTFLIVFVIIKIFGKAAL